jgi:hypothetical protein
MAKTTNTGQEPGSVPLKSPKHEIFAQLHAGGEPECRAYTAAGFKGKDSREGGTRILANPSVKERVGYLLSQRTAVIQAETTKAAESAGIDKAWVMSRLKTVAERCLQHEPVLDARGELVMVETKDGIMAPAYRFDSRGAVAALVPLGKELGMFVERSIVQVSALETASEEQVDRFIVEAAREVGINLQPDATKH